MRAERHLPPPDLAPYLCGFTIVETVAPATRILVPDGSIAMGFRYAGHATQLHVAPGSAPGAGTRMPDASLAPMHKTARHMQTSAGGGMVFAVFREGGIASFFDAPLHEVFGTTLSLDSLLPASAIAETRERVVEASTPEARIAIVADLLRRRRRANVVDGVDQPGSVVMRAVRAIRAAHGSIRIGPLAADLRIGQDALEKRFRRIVGASPKQLASIVRLRRAVDSYEASKSLTRLSLDAGFFDQAHFNRELRAVTGGSPRALFGDDRYC